MRTALLPPLPRRSLVLSSGTLLPLRLRRSAPSRILPAGMAGLAPHLLLVLSETLAMFATLSLSGGCLPGQSVVRLVASMVDGVRDDFCAIAPAEMADVFYPLLTKCALRVQEPLAHKCGIAVDLWKSKGKHLYMKWYRSLLLNPVVQKRHYRFMRGRLMVLLGAVFLDSQCGGFRGKGQGDHPCFAWCAWFPCRPAVPCLPF